MKTISSLATLPLAVALSAGGGLVDHPKSHTTPTADQAPGAYSDITIAQADIEELPPPAEQVLPPPTDEGLPPTPPPPPEVLIPPVEGPGPVVGEGQKNKGIPPAAAVNPYAPSEVR
jgi:hypothetical protein